MRSVRNQSGSMTDDRLDGPAGETGATIELCHVALARQTRAVYGELL